MATGNSSDIPRYVEADVAKVFGNAAAYVFVAPRWNHDAAFCVLALLDDDEVRNLTYALASSLVGLIESLPYPDNDIDELLARYRALADSTHLGGEAA